MNRLHLTHTPGALFDPAQTSRMLFGVWLAPAMAVGFIFCVSRVLAHEHAHRQRIGVVVAGWVLCFAVILVTGGVLHKLAAA